eukprot:1913237-Pleurochrysis_carterae.AAC.10
MPFFFCARFHFDKFLRCVQPRQIAHATHFIPTQSSSCSTRRAPFRRAYLLCDAGSRPAEGAHGEPRRALALRLLRPSSISVLRKGKRRSERASKAPFCAPLEARSSPAQWLAVGGRESSSCHGGTQPSCVSDEP